MLTLPAHQILRPTRSNNLSCLLIDQLVRSTLRWFRIGHGAPGITIVRQHARGLDILDVLDVDFKIVHRLGAGAK